MLLFLLTVAVVLIGGQAIAATISAQVGSYRKPAQPSVFLNSQVSLWSLVLFLFFPEFFAPSSSSLPPRELD